MKRISSLCSSIFPVFFIFTVLLGLQQLSLAAPPLQAQQPTGPRIWLGESQPAVLQQTGAFAPAGPSMPAGAAPSPVSLASADLDGDGVADLVVGYNTGSSGLLSIQRGNLDAFAPQSTASFLAIGHGQFPSPFLAQTQTFAVPVHPDFVVTGDFNGDGHPDVATAARGGSALYVFMGDGKGGLSALQAVNLAGTVTTLAAGNLGRAQLSSLLVGLSDPKTGFSLDVYGETSQGFAQSADFSLSATASNVLFGDFGDAGDDAAFLSGGDVMVLHAASMQLEQISLPVSASAMALGYFIYDRNAHIQIALLSSDGSVHIAAHSEFDPHRLSVAEMQAIRKAVRNGEPNPIVPPPGLAVNGWKIVESIPAAVSFSAGQPPLFFRTRISDNGADDLMVLDGSAGQVEVISHADSAPDAPDFQPAQISTRPYAGSPVAALAMRTNIDGRPGVVALHAGQLAPMVMMPLPDPTFTVNRTDDPTPVSPISGACNGVPNDCSLREAVLKANATAGTDTISVPAGTFTLTRAKVPGDFSGNNGALYIN
ncbi:MAG: FG-GAP-like repeat-containing protein, partial [Actinomycetota bacterium]